ncbi:MAG TPA: ATP-dependent sacrificial sulfur transferase LarE [Bacteroidota bacterium]|nr:ATP-dependent sacrificial sulfur transferase LarE [Bacteroidota bacterium]
MLSEATQRKYDRLVEILRSMESVAIGYSGGVDSTLLLKVAADTLGARAVAMIGRSETYPTREFEEAVNIASAIGARAVIVRTEETDDLKFRENPADRCYYCKTELFGKLGGIAEREGLRWIADGTITDDMGDFRPGMKAKSEKEVRSPLLEADLSKTEVREISKHLGLPTWDKPSFACLSSRFPYGTAITRENLTRVDRAESFLRDNGFRAFRVRFHDASTARIEVSPGEFPRILEDPLRAAIVAMFKEMGFVYVTLDMQGYRTGSMNEVLSEETRSRFSTGH